MNSRSSDPVPVADRTVTVRAELSQPDKKIVVRSEDGILLSEFQFDEERYTRWRYAIGNQAHGSSRPAREAEFAALSRAVTEELAGFVGIAELSRLVAAKEADPAATAFLRVELAGPALDIIPWELLALPLTGHCGRDVCVYRAISVRKKRRTTPAEPPQRVLLIDSSPLSEQSVNFSMEEDSVRRQLKSMERGGLLHLESWRDADPAAITRAMDSPARAVHIAAQGEVGLVHLQQGRAHVKFPGKPFAEFFGGEPQPVAVTMSICQSVPGMPDAPGVARAVAEAGVAQVIGMYSLILPETSLEFFTSLYRSLGDCADMTTAYADAVAALRADLYPNRGFWSVPVLYSQDNVIPFPGTLSDPTGAYRRIACRLAQIRDELSRLRPEDSWSETTWRRKTLNLRMDAVDGRQQLTELIAMIQPEARSGSKWADDVGRAAQSSLRSLDAVVSYGVTSGPSPSSVRDFSESKAKLTEVLEELYDSLAARLEFSF